MSYKLTQQEKKILSVLALVLFVCLLGYLLY